MKFFQNIYLYLLIFPTFCVAQNNAMMISHTITTEDLKKHLSVLASDSLEGRETTTSGNIKAANYIAKHFRGLGLPPLLKTPFLQPIVFSAETWQTNNMVINGKQYASNWDFYAFPSVNSDLNIETNDVVFCGYGIKDKKINDYKNAKKSLKNKILLIYNNEPVDAEGKSLITGTTTMSEWTTNNSKKLETAFAHGAKALLIIDGALQKNLDKYRVQINDGSLKMGDFIIASERFSNSIYISTEMAKNIIGENFKKVVAIRERIEAKKSSKRISLPCKLNMTQIKRSNQLKSSNVLGFIEGNDETLKNEIVVVTAHYDHLGKRGDAIYHGADDDASGTSAVMEIAEAFATAQKAGFGPRRSILCILMTGEEKGLLGSQYYVNNPIYPLQKTVANINIDMIGRTDNTYIGNSNYIYVIGSDKLSRELHDINEDMNKKYTRMILDYKYNDENEPNRYYYRSDHYNFAKNNIPVIFYFNGTHADYHQTSDTVDKINFEALEKRTKLAFFTAWEVANRDKRLELDKK